MSYSNGDGGMSVEKQVVSTEQHSTLNPAKMPKDEV